MSDNNAGGRSPDDRDDLPLRQVLSRDEIRELLSPLRTDHPEERAPVLLVTDRPEDGEDVARCLTRRGVSLVPASHRFAALDWFRQRRYAAVVAGTRSLGVEAQGFVERLREVDASIPIFLICQSDEEPSVDPETPGVEFVERPLSEERLGSLLRCLGFEPGDTPSNDRDASGSSSTGGNPNNRAAADTDSGNSGPGRASGAQPARSATPTGWDRREESARSDTLAPREPSFRPESVTPAEPEPPREYRPAAEARPASGPSQRQAEAQQPDERSADGEPGHDRSSRPSTGDDWGVRERRDESVQRPTSVPTAETPERISAVESNLESDWTLPDPLAAVRSILEARLAGGNLEAGLRRWLHEDERVAGMAILERESPAELESPGTVGLGSAGYSCRAISTTAALREEILRAVGSHLGETVFEDERPVRVEGPFFVFAEPSESRATTKRWAVYVPRIAEAPGPAQALAERLVEIMGTLRRVPSEHAGSETFGAGRSSGVSAGHSSAEPARTGLPDGRAGRAEAWFAEAGRSETQPSAAAQPAGTAPESEPELTRVRARLDALERWLTAESHPTDHG